MTRLRVDVDASAISANAAQLARVLGRSELWAVVKADGYGHGALRSARAALAGGASRIAVATLDEGLALRRALGADVAIIVLGPLEPGRAREAFGLELCLSTPDGLRELGAASFRGIVHVKADTGMGRWGLAPPDALALGRSLAAGEVAGVTLGGLMSHLANADAPDPAHLRLQTARFAELAASFPPCPRHLANSAGALWHPETRLDAARCGIALFGVAPDDGDASGDGLRPALRVASTVVAVRTLAPGESSGYGRRLIAAAETRVATIPVGYADGYPRALSGRADVLVRGRRCRVAATVSMDALSVVVDRDVEVGDEVVLLGDQGSERIRAEELARQAGTIGYEICCGFRERAWRSEQWSP
ncbi:MAG: alanine racemase [Gaiellales bacterium]